MIINLGDKFKEKFTVTDKVYNGFIKIFRDKNPLHIDDKFALVKGFKSKVMHGNILNGFLSYFIGECLPTKDVIIHSQEIQFKKPVYLGDELDLIVQVVAVYKSVNAVECKFVFKSKEAITVAKGKFQIGVLR